MKNVALNPICSSSGATNWICDLTASSKVSTTVLSGTLSTALLTGLKPNVSKIEERTNISRFGRGCLISGGDSRCTGRTGAIITGLGTEEPACREAGKLRPEAIQIF